MAADTAPWLTHLRRYILASAVGHLAWETLQLPLYTIWFDGTMAQIAFAIAHCTVGDIMIGVATLAPAILAFGRGWPGNSTAFRNVALTAVALGVSYTVFSEWLNVNVRGSWNYSSWMPRLPPLGTGLSPVLQWIVIPTLAFWWARRHQTNR